jgi:hypothetical protein
MNKHNTQSILKYLLLIVIALSSGCGQSTIIDSSISLTAPVIPTVTVTSLPCYAWTQTSTTELEKIAEKWFLSSIPQIPERNQYRFVDTGEAWAVFCGNYQHLIITNNPIARNPIDISLRLITQSAGDNHFQIDNIIVAAVYSADLLTNNSPSFSSSLSRNIMTVTVTHPYIDILLEERIDYVFENDIWKIKWWGSRWKCINNKELEWKNAGKIDC